MRLVDKLSPKRRKFVLEYVKDFNGKQAAIRAGYSPKTAEVQASRLLSNANLKAAADELSDSAVKKAGVEVGQVISELAYGAFVDPADVFDSSGDAKPMCDIPPHVRRAISSIDTITRPDGSKVVKVKLIDKPRCLEMLGRYLGMFKDKVEHSGSGFQLVIHES